MKLKIIGKDGRFGSVIAKIAAKNGNEIVDNGQDYTILAIPSEPTVDYISKHNENIIEVTSVKEPIKPFRDRIISIHPLFGPMTYEDGIHNILLFINDISIRGSIKTIREIFYGYRIVELSAEEHDRKMVETLVIPYMVALLSTHIRSDFLSRSFERFSQLSGIVEGENMDVMLDTIRKNPFSDDALKDVCNKMRGIFNDNDTNR
ncbi:MAG: hypothetical protein ACP5UV_06770 [Thermoplasmata archaeon]